jgi:hypothetical protein
MKLINPSLFNAFHVITHAGRALTSKAIVVLAAQREIKEFRYLIKIENVIVYLDT